jgi:hypothetical protein
VELEIDVVNLGALLRDKGGGRLGRSFFLLFNLCKHVFSPIFRQGKRFKEIGNLRIKGFFADIRLAATPSLVLLGAAVILYCEPDASDSAASVGLNS